MESGLTNAIRMSVHKKNAMQWSSWHHRLQKKLLKQPELLPKGSCLLLSISGGQDSMALVKLLFDLQKIHEWKLNIWHGDHQWHKNSTQIAKELKLWCEKQNLQFFYNRADQGQIKTEEEAREWRYANLFKHACLLSSSQEKEFCRVLTGHTGSDRAETLIMNLARGTDLIGLTTLREQRILNENIKLVRPLLELSRNETELICKKLNLPIWIDPSNENLKYKRNKIRHNVLPILEELHQGCTLRISNLAERLSHYEENQSTLLRIALETIQNEKGICREKLISFPQSIRISLIAKFFQTYKISGITSKILDEINNKISDGKPPGNIKLKGGWTITWTKELIQIFDT